MDIPAEAKALESRVKNAGLSIQPILDEAGVARSTWSRWKAGSFTPRLDTWSKVHSVAQKRLSPKVATA